MINAIKKTAIMTLRAAHGEASTTVYCLLLALLISGCASEPTFRNDDRYPKNPPDVSGVKDPDVRAEPKCKFGNPKSYTVMGETYYVRESSDDFVQRGVASWYGEKFHGGRTSCGEAYDMYKMTAAHKTLPLPTYLKVTNLDNQRSVIVRVNDRGPFVKNRIIDLSYAAAHKLGMAGKGTANVEIRVVSATKTSASTATDDGDEAPKPSANGAWFVQVGAFSRQASATEVADQVKPLVGYPVTVQHGNGVYRVRVGPLSNRDVAEKVQDYLEDKGYDDPSLVAP